MESGEIKAIGETVRFLYRLQNHSASSENDKRFAQTWIDRSRDVIRRPFDSGRALNLKYYTGTRNRNKYAEQFKILAALLSLETIEIQGTEIKKSNTVWDEVERGIPHLRRELDKTLDEIQNGEQTGDIWFIILNTLETLNSVEQLCDIDDEPDNFRRLVTKHEPDLRDEMDSSESLKIYAYDLAHRDILQIDVNEPPFQGDIYHAMGRLYRGHEIAPSDITYKSRLEHLYAIARAWARAVNNEDTGVVPFYDRLDTKELYRRVWGDRRQIKQEFISDDNIKRVTSMNDKEIQQCLSKIFSANEYLTQASKSSLGQELEKAHAGGEISDFDIEIEVDNRVISVSFPIKSGAEAGSRSAGKLAEDNLHQIVRPATRYKNERAVVFPVLIAGLTLNANETIKSWRSNFDIPIIVIDKQEFTKILAYHDIS